MADSQPFSALVVDDNADAADSLAAVLAANGFRAAAVYAPLDALRRVAEEPFDAVLLDLNMPGMDGAALAATIVALPAPRRPFLIAVTASSDPADRARCQAAGVDLYLVKPVDPVAVAVALGRIQRFLIAASPPTAYDDGPAYPLPRL